jgi:type IV pilus assembly protein PilY1
MTVCTSLPRLLALAAAVALAVGAREAGAQTCQDPAARDLLATSYLDTALNPPVGEDLEFLYKETGLPNIMVLFDSSTSMRRLPPDGPGRIGGSSPTLPPGYRLTDPTSATEQSAAYSAPRTVGCGLDPVSQTTPGFLDSQTVQGIGERRFYPPCGRAVSDGLVGATYQGHDTRYADEMTVCPYFTSSNNQATGAAGYDPDFYNGAGPMATTANGRPVFFGRDLIFHDTVGTGGTYARQPSVTFEHNFGNGWTDTAVFPFRTSGGTLATAASFCAAQGTTLQGALTHEEICNQCLTDKGWYYDGILLQGTEGATSFTYPSLWYTGNYLNFFPPKFLSARKVVKDVIAAQSKVRMALARFDAMTHSNPGATFFQDFNPSCGQPDNSSFDSNRASYISGLNSSGNLNFSTGTPLANALFDVGRYYHSPDLPWFGTTWENSSKESASNANQYAVCYSCQVSTVILLTDGMPDPNDGGTLPPNATTAADTSGKYAGDATTGIRGITSETCPSCGAFGGAQDYLNNLPRVAWYLNNMDLRRNTETTLDCNSMGGKQVIQTYTVGFGTGQLPAANAVLRNTAEAGGGIFVGAEDPAALKDGINYVIQEISNRSTSFSVATVSTLQTTSGRAVIVPRFDPNKTAHWQGHLYRFDLYSEFVNACVPYGEGDLDCDGQCVSAFLSDDSGNDSVTSLVSEDGNGAFVRNEPSDQPLCSQAPACGATQCGVPGNESARPFWDAGAELANQSWKTRNVWTVVDTNGDGRIDADDAMVDLTGATDAAALKIVPYLALGTSATGQSVCGDLANRLVGAGDPAGADRIRSDTSKVECAKTIIRFALGADVLNTLGKAAPEWPRAPEQLLDRAFKLGDIFHSSPVVVDPPLPRDGILCRSGLSNQCISSLWGTPTENGEAGYDAYSKSSHYKDRRKIILVGANDGLLHAFNGGKWIGNPTPGVSNPAADDPFTTAVDESLPPFNGYYERGAADGAKELWAFLPPDMIAKLPLLMGSRHQYFVDGTAMVRDVWVDGTSNRVGTGTKDARKQGGEFHTVAVVGERRGGTRYFALDVTDATEFDTSPKFLWIYPQPGDRRSLEFGATYSDFLPVAPPIGPVRIRPDADHPLRAGVTPEIDVPGEGTVAYNERWVALLSGGFDPSYVRGRGVYMVDVWTGKELFDFSYPRDPSSIPVGDPRHQLRFPIAATVGMVPWGANAKRAADETNDRFFDTATFGDAGGQLWVLRFSVPGALGAHGKVTNWYGARIFQMGGAADCKLCGGQPFFYITANMPLPSNMAYRVFAGTGDRFNLLDTNGGICGPDNIRACVQRGCTVTLGAEENFLQATGPGTSRSSLQQTACGALSSTQSDTSLATCGAGGRARIQISNCPGSLSTASDFELSCTQMSDGYRCTQVRSIPGQTLAISDSTNPITVGNWYLSLLVFEDAPSARKIFATADEALEYDANRLWITQTNATTRSASPGIVTMAASNDSPTGADATSKGWALYYDHGPSATVGNNVFTVAWQDERTSSASAVGEGLITWNATQPSQGQVQAATTGGCRVARCLAEKRRVAYHYGADPETGLPFQGFKQDGAVVRSIASYLLVPSQADQTTVFVNQKGQVAVGLTAVNPEKGATNVGMGDPIDPTTDLGVVEVSRTLHACRHTDPPTCR